MQAAEGGCNFAEVPKLEGSFTEAAAGHHRNGICGAPIDLDERHQTLPISALRLEDPEQFETMDGQPQPENLSRAHVPMRGGGELFVFSQRTHVVYLSGCASGSATGLAGSTYWPLSHGDAAC